MPTELETKQSEYNAKKSTLEKLFDEATGNDGEVWITNIKSVKNPVEHVATQHKELSGLRDEIDGLRQIEITNLELKAREAEHEAAMKKVRPDLGRDAPRSSAGDRTDPEWVEKAVKALTNAPDLQVHNSQVGLRALFDSASYDPKTVRDDGLYTPAATRPIQFIQRLRQIPIMTDTEVYMEQNAIVDATGDEASVAEGAVYHELAFSATEKANRVKGYGVFIPATKWVLEDDPMSSEMLQTDLPMELMRILDKELLYGSGTGVQNSGTGDTSENIAGLMNITGIQTQAKDADSGIVAISKAIEKVQITGQSDPDFIIMHPSDWWVIARAQTTAGSFIMTNPSEVAPMRLWGLPVYPVQALTQGEALVGAFAQYTHIRDRQSLDTYWMEQMAVASDLTVPTGKRMLVGDVRLCLTNRRPASLCKTTGL